MNGMCGNRAKKRHKKVDPKIIKRAEHYLKISQITTPQPVQTIIPSPEQTKKIQPKELPSTLLKRWLKHVPYNYGGRGGTLLGTMTVHGENDNYISPNSGVISHLIELAKISQANNIQIAIHVSPTGGITFSGNPGNFINKVSQVFKPIFEKEIARFSQGNPDPDFEGLEIPNTGIVMDWIKLAIPQEA